MNHKPNNVTQEIEAEELIEELRDRLRKPSVAEPCTPEAHRDVVDTTKDILRAQIWQIRRLDRNGNNGHSAKFKFGPLSISGVSAAVVYRLAGLAGIAYLIGKAKGWLP